MDKTKVPKKMREKKIKRKSLAKLKRELWRVLRIFIIQRDVKVAKGRCLSCVYIFGQEGPGIECVCHILPKVNYRGVEFDTDNLYGGCFGCNVAEHYDRLGWSDKFKKWLGTEKYDELKRRGRERKVWTREILEYKIKYYSQLI